MTRIPYRQDAGHGWIGVPLEELKRLDLHAEISSCSYFDRERRLVWLEEDSDAMRYMQRLEQRGLPRPELHECDTITAGRRIAEEYGTTADRASIIRVSDGVMVASHRRDTSGDGTCWYKATY